MISSVLPIALYLTFGYIFKILFRDNSKELVEFVIYFSLPAIIFVNIYPLELSINTIWLILMFNTIILLTIVFSFFIGRLLKLEKKSLATFILITSFGNTSFVGFSYISAFYGEEFLSYAIIYDLFGSFLLLVSVGMVIISYGNGQSINIKRVTKNILFFPPIIMFFVTLVVKNFEIPALILNTMDTLGSTLVPIAMIAIGMKLELKDAFYKFKIVLSSIVIKMIILPTIVLVCFYYFYNIDETWIKTTILEVAMPAMTTAVILAIKEKLDEKLAINTLVIGVLFSFFSISIFYYILQ